MRTQTSQEVATAERITLHFEPLFPLEGAWQWLTVAAIVVIAGCLTWVIYRRDAEELPTGIRWLLNGWRVLALAVLVIFFVQPQVRHGALLTKPSRVAVLIDTSLSMGLPDEPDQLDRSRMERVVKSLANAGWLQDLAKQHEVSVYRFDESPQPGLVCQLGTRGGAPKNEMSDVNLARSNLPYQQQGMMLRLAGLVTAIAGFVVAAACLTAGARQWTGPARGWITFLGLGLLTFGAIGLALGDLLDPRIWPSNQREVQASRSAEAVLPAVEGMGGEQVDWEEELRPRGASTRLGQAITWVVGKERGGPVAGIILISDGGQNAGASAEQAAAAAQSANIPLFVVGVGNLESPRNAELMELQAPSQAFHGDRFKLKGAVQVRGMEGQTLKIRLESQSDVNEASPTIEDELQLKLESDADSLPFEFEALASQKGKRQFTVRVLDLPGELDVRDNVKSCSVDIVDRRTVVLLIAGGPMRDFHFLRNQLYRDQEIELLVWLQSAQAGSDQESAEQVFTFPKTREELDKIDCIVAFDPDWRRLTPAESGLLEQWVAENAGGLVVVAGPVNTPEWTRAAPNDPTIEPIRGLYPVSFFGQGSAVLKLGRFGGERPFPLDLTREGRSMDFLRLGEQDEISQQNWARFPGVYGYYAVNEPKLGADILANFSDPDTAVDNRLPIYLAAQFYGTGRVVFQASGEIWRLRTVQVEFFQQYYSRLIRWSAQGRSTRGSARGLLMTERPRYWLGEQVIVKALVRDPQGKPLTLPELQLNVLNPLGDSQDIFLTLTSEGGRGGAYAGAFPANQAGEYRLRLPIPGGEASEIFNQSISVSIPDLEKLQPRRNFKLLAELAATTGGHYFQDLLELNQKEGDNSLNALIPPQDQQSYLPGVADFDFHRRLMIWLMSLATLFLSMEWTVRRLHKLA